MKRAGFIILSLFLLVSCGSVRSAKTAQTEGEYDVFHLNENGEPVPATNPLNQYSTIRKGLSAQQICPGYGFSSKVSKETGRRILLVVNAKGGTTIRSG